MPIDQVRRVVVGPVESLPPGERTVVTPFQGTCRHRRVQCARHVPCAAQPLPAQAWAAVHGTSEWPRRGRRATVNLCSWSAGRTGWCDLRCPWHLWEFEIASGQCLVDPRMRVRTYPVTIEQGQIVVYASAADLPPAAASAHHGPDNLLGTTP